MDQSAENGLIETYLRERAALLRYFSLRTGSHSRAEDLVQEVYLKISELEPGAVAELRNPVGFLYRMGSNLMLDRLKQERRSGARDAEWRRSQVVETAGEDAADVPAADQAVAARQRLEKILSLLRELSPQTQRAVRLHKFEGLSHAETAAAMGVSKSAVEKHISAALRHLSRKLE